MKKEMKKFIKLINDKSDTKLERVQLYNLNDLNPIFANIEDLIKKDEISNAINLLVDYQTTNDDPYSDFYLGKLYCLLGNNNMDKQKLKLALSYFEKALEKGVKAAAPEIGSIYSNWPFHNLELAFKYASMFVEEGCSRSSLVLGDLLLKSEDYSGKIEFKELARKLLTYAYRCKEPGSAFSLYKLKEACENRQFQYLNESLEDNYHKKDVVYAIISRHYLYNYNRNKAYEFLMKALNVKRPSENAIYSLYLYFKKSNRTMGSDELNKWFSNFMYQMAENMSAIAILQVSEFCRLGLFGFGYYRDDANGRACYDCLVKYYDRYIESYYYDFYYSRYLVGWMVEIANHMHYDGYKYRNILNYSNNRINKQHKAIKKMLRKMKLL